MMHRVRSSAFLAAALAALTFAQPVLAAVDDPYYDKGRNYNAQLFDITTRGSLSTFVISAQAFYYPSGGWGRERIRVWGRKETVTNEYPSTWHVSGISRADIRFMSNCDSSSPNTYESRCTVLGMTGTDPGPTSTDTSFMAIAYDLLGYKGIVTDTIGAIVNGVTASVSRDEAMGYDQTVKLNAGYFSVFDNSIASLSNTIKYSDADGAVAGQTSGLSVKFDYHLLPEHTNFKVWPQGQVDFLVYDAGGHPFHVVSGAAGVVHTVNTK